jgi:integrase
VPKLTDRYLEGLSLSEGQRDRLVFDVACPGLGVRLTKAGRRVFIAQWTDPATKRKVREPLGVWGAITIDQARDAAKVKLGAVAKGINPKAERIMARAEAERERAELALTFDALVTDWKSLHLVERRPRYAAEAERAIRHAFPDLMKRPAARITKAEITNRLDKMIRAGKATTAGRTMAYGRAAFSWAVKRGKLDQNPFAGLPITAPTNQRERTLSEVEIRDVWAASGTLPVPVGAFIRLALLTLARRDEVAGMRWSEISVDGSEWIIPGARTKNGKPHGVHLSQAAIETLATLPKVEGQDLVFTTTGKTSISGFSAFKRELDKAIVAARQNAAMEAAKPPAPLVPFVLHDFRRTGVTTLAGMGFDSIVVDKLLNHQPSKLRGVASVYQRHEFSAERARALDVWAKVCTEDMDAAGTVTPLRAVSR